MQKKKILQMKCINIFFQGNTFALIEAEAFVCSTFKKTTTTKDDTMYLGPVAAGSPSRGGDVAVDVFNTNQPSVPTPFYSVLVLSLIHI